MAKFPLIVSLKTDDVFPSLVMVHESACVPPEGLVVCDQSLNVLAFEFDLWVPAACYQLVAAASSVRNYILLDRKRFVFLEIQIEATGVYIFELASTACIGLVRYYYLALEKNHRILVAVIA